MGEEENDTRSGPQCPDGSRKDGFEGVHVLKAEQEDGGVLRTFLDLADAGDLAGVSENETTVTTVERAD